MSAKRSYYTQTIFKISHLASNTSQPKLAIVLKCETVSRRKSFCRLKYFTRSITHSPLFVVYVPHSRHYLPVHLANQKRCSAHASSRSRTGGFIYTPESAGDIFKCGALVQQRTDVPILQSKICWIYYNCHRRHIRITVQKYYTVISITTSKFFSLSVNHEVDKS